MLLITIAILITYLHIAHAPFIFDDALYISENPFVTTPGMLRGIPADDIEGFSRTRYLAYLSFRGNYILGGDEPFGYHAVNIGIHIANSLLAYIFITLLVRAAGVAPGAIPLAVALLFALHPVQTQAVTYITQRFTSLCAMFYLCSIACYAAYRQLGRAPLYWISLPSAIAAMLNKEIAFTLPLAIGMYELAFHKGDKKRLVPLVPFAAMLLVIPTIRLLHASSISLASASMLRYSRHDYLITQFRVMATYLRLLALPVNQTLDYDYRLSTSLAEPAVLASLALIFAIAACGVWLTVRRQGLLRLAGFGIIWFFLTLLVESSVVPLGDLIFEHRLYLPSLGAALALGATAAYIAKRHQLNKKAVAAVAACVILALGVAAYERNTVWTSMSGIWNDTLIKSPLKARVHANYGVGLAADGDAEGAIRELQAAIKLDPAEAKAYFNLGNIYADRNMPQKAIELYEKSIALKPVAATYANLGDIYTEQQMYDKAADAISKAIELNPSDPIAQNSMGILQSRMARHDLAIKYFEKAIELSPQFASAHYNRAVELLGSGNREAALGELSILTRISPAQAEQLRSVMR